MAPDLVAAFVEEFNTEMRNLAASAERESLAAKRSLAEIERKLAAIVRAIEDGAYTHTLKARLSALEQEKAQAEARLRAGKRAPVLRLHTNLPELYRSKIGRLAEALTAPETVTEAAETGMAPIPPSNSTNSWAAPAESGASATTAGSSNDGIFI